MQHVEEPDLVGDGVMNEGELASRLGLLGIPREAETVMLERDIRLVRLTGARYHAAMISCADSVEIVRRAKAGRPAGHLRRLDQQPRPQRERHRPLPHLLPGSRRRCATRTTGSPWSQALDEGVIDVIVSDHNPQDVETKRLPFAEAADGAVGIETLLGGGPAPRPCRRRRPAAAAARRCRRSPAEILGREAGRLAPARRPTSS